MMPSSYHTHTVYCDGRDTPEELVLEAIRLGCPEIGFSGHSHTSFDESYCMSPEGTRKYKECVLALREKYADKIKVLLGVEQDYFSDAPTEGYDYVIGSVHYVKKDGLYLPVDESRETQQRIVEKHYAGDYLAFAEDYFKLAGEIFEKTGCDIIGHFDLIGKFNEKRDLFDPDDPRYRSAADKAIEHLIGCGAAFEINYGAVALGYKSTPYPEARLIKKLTDAGVRLIKTSDCHDRSTLLFGLT